MFLFSVLRREPDSDVFNNENFQVDLHYSNTEYFSVNAKIIPFRIRASESNLSVPTKVTYTYHSKQVAHHAFLVL